MLSEVSGSRCLLIEHPGALGYIKNNMYTQNMDMSGARFSVSVETRKQMKHTIRV